MIFPFPPFEPDKGQFSTDATSYVINMQPTSSGWGPIPSLTTISTALPAECRGAAYVITSTGTIRIVAATATNIYQLDTSTYTWTSITGAAGPYHLNANDYWTFTLFGNSLIIHNISDPIQVYDVTTGGTVTTLAGSPPQAKYSWVSGDYLVLGYLSTTSGERTVQWSGLNDATHWVIGKKGADSQELPEGNEVMGGFGDQGGFYVLQKSAMQFFGFAPGSGYTFTRTIVNPKRGVVSPRSIVSVGPTQFYYLSEDGFMSGAERKPIGAERVDNWFMDNLDISTIADVQGASDPFEKIVWWRFKTNSGLYARIGYNWELDRWTYSDVNVTEMTTMAKPGVTWDGLATLYASIDAVDLPFDSRVFLGGRPTFAAFTPDFKLGFFAGGNLLARIDTPLMQFDINRRAFVRNARVVTDASNYYLRGAVADYHGDSLTFSPGVTPNTRSQMCDFRNDGRLHKIRLTIHSNDVWDNVNSVSLDAVLTGTV